MIESISGESPCNENNYLNDLRIFASLSLSDNEEDDNSKTKIVLAQKIEKKSKSERKKEKRLKKIENQRLYRREKRRQLKLKKKLYKTQNLGKSSNVHEYKGMKERLEIKNRQMSKLIEGYHKGVKICINLSFNDFMLKENISSLAKQVYQSFLAIKRLEYPVQLHLTSFDPSSFLSAELDRYKGKSFMAHENSSPYWEIFDSNNLVVLTPDAEEDLDDVSVDKVYIIGGLVDRSIHKNGTQLQAVKYGGFECRRFPIKQYLKDYMKMCGTMIFTVNLSIEMLIKRFIGHSWSHIFDTSISTRKKGTESKRSRRREHQNARRNPGTSDSILRSV